MLAIALALALGGLLKGATGVGSPLVAIPVIALYYDVPLAITVMLVPNLMSNIWQVWTHWDDIGAKQLAFTFALTGVAGAVAGNLLLVSAPPDALLLLVAGAVFAYIGFRLARPDWVLAEQPALRLAAPAGTLSGVLQGAAGISAPVALTYLNAQKLPRARFVPVISLFFLLVTLPQFPLLAHFGVLTWERLAISAAAVIPLVGLMPVGAWLARHIPQALFDKVILALLALIALRIAVGALW